MKDIECPYCGHGFDICNDDGHGYDEDVRHEEECPNCEKWFVFTTTITFSYEAQEAPCLNTGEHKLKMTNTVPRFMSKMRCGYCDFERRATDEEILEKYPDALEERKELLSK